MTVQVNQSLYGLGDVVHRLNLGKEFFLSQSIEERRLSQLQDQIEVCALFVVFVKLKAMLML